MSELGSMSLTAGFPGFSSGDVLCTTECCVCVVGVDDDNDAETIEGDAAIEVGDTEVGVVECLLLEMVTVTVGALGA